MKNVYGALNRVKVDPSEYKEITMTDFEKASAKRRIHKAVSRKSGQKVLYRWTAVAACAVFAVCISQTAYAQSIINGIVNQINLGHNSVVQMDSNQKPSSSPYSVKNGVVYDAKGKEVGTVANGDKQHADAGRETETDWNKAISQLNFKPLCTQKLPKDYSFDSATLYKGENGKVGGDYLAFEYKNGTDKISVNERKITPKTTVTYATDGTVEKAKVNGHEAALTDGHSVEWEANGVLVSITAKSLTSQQLIALAESFS